MLTQTIKANEKIYQIKIDDKFTQADMKAYAQELEDAIAKVGQIRLLIVMNQFPKIEPAAFWEDLKFSVKHFKDIERIALVGQPEWEKWYANLVDMLPNIKVKHFYLSNMRTAYNWLNEDLKTE